MSRSVDHNGKQDTEDKVAAVELLGLQCSTDVTTHADDSELQMSQLTQVSDVTGMSQIWKHDNNTTMSHQQSISTARQVVESYTKTEMKNKVMNFQDNDPTTHIFIQTAQGTPNKWEHIPRRFFYVELIKPVLSTVAQTESQNLSLSTCHTTVFLQYKSVTGCDEFPPCYTFCKNTKKYLKMNDDELNTYVKSIFDKIDRVNSAIKRYEDFPGGMIKKIQRLGNENVSYILKCFIH